MDLTNKQWLRLAISRAEFHEPSDQEDVAVQATMLVAGNMIGTGISFFRSTWRRRRHRSLRLAGCRRWRRGAGACFRQARRTGSAGGRALRLRARLPRPVRRLPDQLHLLVRQLDRQHRDRGGRRGLSGRVRPADQRPPASVIATAVVIWVLTFANILGRASSARSRPGPWPSR